MQWRAVVGRKVRIPFLSLQDLGQLEQMAKYNDKTFVISPILSTVVKNNLPCSLSISRTQFVKAAVLDTFDPKSLVLEY